MTERKRAQQSRPPAEREGWLLKWMREHGPISPYGFVSQHYHLYTGASPTTTLLEDLKNLIAVGLVRKIRIDKNRNKSGARYRYELNVKD